MRGGPVAPGRGGNGLGGHRVTAVEESRKSVLDASGWSFPAEENAAETLGLNRSTLPFRMKKLGISRPAAAGLGVET
jgi:transcriptional regulator with GAF, ATPase, and Fis domain